VRFAWLGALGLVGCAQVLHIDDTSGAAATSDAHPADGGGDGAGVCPSGSMSFAFTGATQTLTRPACAVQLTVDVRGAAGGTSFYLAAIGTPGLGGRVQGVLAVAPDDVITVTVGGVGGNASSGIAGAAGFNGGGAGAVNSAAPAPQTGGGGGGASDIRVNGTTLADRVIVAAGGGGAAACFGAPHAGGDGGGTTGGVGDPCPSTTAQPGGGTQSAGGAGGIYPAYADGSPGDVGVGGAAGPGTGGGGGGAGYFGGGGGSWNGGAGGSSFAVASLRDVTITSGAQNGAGSVTISW